MHYVFEPLDTEFGAFFMNYHSRDPILSGQAASQSAYNAAAGAGALAPMIVAGNSSYYVEYPEDIRLYGLSFATTLSTGTRWKGELSYRPNAPVQLNRLPVRMSSGLLKLVSSITTKGIKIGRASCRERV